MTKLPNALFLSHGGGPLPLLGDPGHQEMVSCLRTIATKFPKPDALLVISAHWEESMPTVTSGEHPSLIYDYYGFPEESYQIQYPCAGEPSLAAEILTTLNNAEIDAISDASRGFDHGLFVPLKIMYPEADIPCVQLSLVRNLDPVTHLDMGRALRSLNRQNVLIVGSGFSFHNLSAFFAADNLETREFNHVFEEWLLDTCRGAEYSEEDRSRRLVQWSRAPGARFCHPREEHLLPLHVCYGVAQTSCTEYFELKILNKKCSMYLWRD